MSVHANLSMHSDYTKGVDMKSSGRKIRECMKNVSV